MSRSKRKVPIRSWCGGDSESWDKKKWHRRFRVAERVRLRAVNNDNADTYVTTHFREHSNIWDMWKDGKGWWDLKNLYSWKGKEYKVMGK